ncbi:2-oxoglutarate dehydrogenase E1 component [Buchnera aphidicola (Astegopteryx bambusae)]|uniref:2-oxoglutarate dehydrogenase E1 component n=1 Tax=Buchnera aphidicola TaxID=9 RepID=UPI0031B7F96D
MKKNKNSKNFFTHLHLYNHNYLENIFKKFLKKKSYVKKEFQLIFKKFIIQNNKKEKIIEKHDIKNLIFFFRSYGHIISKTNPIKKTCKNIKNFLYFKKKYNLLIKNYNKNKIEKDYIKTYEKMKKIYSNHIGIEYMHIFSEKEKKWIKNNLEKKKRKKINNKNNKKLLKNLIITNYFEKYLNIKFPGAKRFSLEGSEIIIPILKEVIKYSKKNNISNIILGMSHRGRINVLRNIFKKSLNTIFDEFENFYEEKNKIDDVKYHLGYKKTILYKENKIFLEIKNNPSHLESICPVVIGSARFYIEKNSKEKNKKSVLPILIHGDASISGQGIIQETLNMSKTKGFDVGGTIHIVINNQIGFTTSKISEMRSSKYCTDISKMISCPVFHVNSDFPEESIFIINLALKFRRTFKKDVFIDIISYRKHGHHESDDPKATQPKMYNIIEKHKPVYKIYEKKLIKKRKISILEIENIKKKYKKFLEKKYFEYKNKLKLHFTKKIINKNISKKKKKNIKISFENFKKLSIQINKIPKNMHLHEIVKKIYKNRMLMSKEKKKFDWSAAEALSIANLLKKGISCRISGEDVSRGTFFQRHSIVYDQTKNFHYIPLCHVNKKNNFCIWNSSLSEEAVLAFEYGYSISSKKSINIWEAQFGDFANSAQVIIDQFITSGKKKWGQTCGLIMFLPHGYEGQGPEHSSARLERFLQMSSEKNIQIVQPTNTSQIYHIIQNQIYKKNITPLIIMSPKSMLRNTKSFKSLKDIYLEKFRNIIYKKKFCYKKIKKIIFCSGKIFYELNSYTTKKHIDKLLIIRIERLYPFPKNEIFSILQFCKNTKNFIWVQEEPKNQGAWNFVSKYIKKLIPHNSKLICISRNSSSSVSTGSIKIHKKEQYKIIKKSLFL